MNLLRRELNDMIISDNNHIYNRENEFAFVHKTNYMPQNNSVKSVYSAGGIYSATGNLFGINFDYEYPIADDYIHFSINCEASEINDYYGFNNRKYAIIVLGSEEEFKNISRFSSNDVEFCGIKNISNGYLLCPETEFESCKVANPNAIVVPYEGEYVDGYANLLLQKLGYNVEKINDNKEFEWENNNPDRVKFIQDKYGFEFSPYAMKYFFENRANQQIERLKSFCKKIISVAINNNINVFELLESFDDILKENKISLSSLKKINKKIEIPQIKLEDDIVNNYLVNFIFCNQTPEMLIFMSELLKISESIIEDNYKIMYGSKKSSHER